MKKKVFGRKQLTAKRGVSEGMFCFELKEKKMEMGLVLCVCVYYCVRLGLPSSDRSALPPALDQ